MSKSGHGKSVRLNELDWVILEVMADGRRYTQQHLYDDIDKLEEYSSAWIRKRIKHLHDNALIEKVGTSSMYTISEYGLAALRIRDDLPDDISPMEQGKRIRTHAGSA